MKRKKLTNKQVKRILRQAGAAHRHQAAVSEPKPAVEAEEQKEQLAPGLYLVDQHGNMRLVAVPGEESVLPPGFVPCVPMAGSAPNPTAMPTIPSRQEMIDFLKANKFVNDPGPHISDSWIKCWYDAALEELKAQGLGPAAMPAQSPPLPVQAEAARAAMPSPETLEAYPIPKAMQLVRASKTLAEASADELLDELEVKLPAFLLACPAGSGATRFRSHGRQSEAIGLYQLLTMWMQRQMCS